MHDEELPAPHSDLFVLPAQPERGLELKTTHRSHVLFLCIATSARSQIAEGLVLRILDRRADVVISGSQPSRLNPLAVAAIKDINFDISDHHSKSVDDIDAINVNLVIALCGAACAVVDRPGWQPDRNPRAPDGRG